MIRPLATLVECDHFQKVEQLIWGSDAESLVPIHILVTLSHNGGLIMGAYADDGPVETGGMVGIVLGWYGMATPPGDGAPGGSAPRLKFCSHMAGVLPPWQRQRVGLRLKLAQRDWVRAQGVTDWITWTYDPLYRANGVFNIHRLGAVCRTYIRDLYGEMTDVLNAGGPSDRFQVDWWIESERVQAAVARAARGADESAAGAPAAAPAKPPAVRYPGLQTHKAQVGSGVRPDFVRPSWSGAPVAIPIPDDIAALRRRDRALALEWRYYVRGLMEDAFAAGYAVVDCVHTPSGEWCYILAPDTAH